MKTRAKTLGSILDHNERITLPNRVDVVHFRALTVETHRHDRTSTGTDRVLNSVRIEVKSLGIDIDINRNTAQKCDRFPGSKERKRRGNDLIAWLDADCHQGG